MTLESPAASGVHSSEARAQEPGPEQSTLPLDTRRSRPGPSKVVVGAADADDVTDWKVLAAASTAQADLRKSLGAIEATLMKDGNKRP